MKKRKFILNVNLAGFIALTADTGSDLVFTSAGGATVTFRNTQQADLDETDFVGLNGGAMMSTSVELGEAEASFDASTNFAANQVIGYWGNEDSFDFSMLKRAESRPEDVVSDLELVDLVTPEAELAPEYDWATDLDLRHEDITSPFADDWGEGLI